jgi:hypothetical protein
MSERARQLGVRALFSALAFIVSWVSADRIFHRRPITSDENSYVFQAYNFIDGCIARPAPPYPEAFLHGMIIIHQTAGWFSRYPPGHSAWLVPGALLEDLRISVAGAAAISMWFLCAAAVALGIAQAFVAVPLLLSPYFIFMYGTHLSHTSGLAAVALMCWAYIKGQQGGARCYFAVAGLAWGLLFLNRTYTALLMAIPFGLHAIAIYARQRTWDAFSRMFVFAIASASGVMLYLLYNKLATGDALQATYLFYDPSEGLGFGPRRMLGATVMHTPERGFLFFKINIALMDRWLLGFTGSLTAALFVAMYGWSRRWSLVLLGAAVCVWLGYIAFWYPGISDAGGPVYYFETLAPVMLLTGLGLQRAWLRAMAFSRMRLAAAIAVILAIAINSGAFMAREAAKREPKQRLRRAIDEMVDRLPRGSIIFFEEMIFPDDHEIAFNPRGLDSVRLRLRSVYADNVVLQRFFSGRPAYLIRGSDPLNPILLPPPERVVISREAGHFLRRIGRDVTNLMGSGAILVDEAMGPADWIAYGRQLFVPAGQYLVRWFGTSRGIDSRRPVLVDVISQGGERIFAQTNFYGTRDGVLAEMTLALTNGITSIEPRIWYGGSGSLLLREIRIEEVYPTR